MICRNCPFFILLLLLFAVTGCNKSGSENPKLLLISFDGFSHDYLERVNTPHFDSLSAGGVKAEGLVPVFPSKTFPNHYSIVTGLYPENSELIDNNMYDPEWDEWYRIRHRDAVEDGKWYGGEPIWNTLEKQGITTGTMFWVGSEADIQDRQPTYWKTYDEDMSPEARIDTVVKWMSSPDGQAADFATLYFEHVDTQGHHYGPHSDSVKAAIEYADELVGYLKKQFHTEGLWDNTNIIMLSDHGMTDLSADKIIELDKLINMEQIERTIWGPLTMIQPKEGEEDEVYQRLKSAEENYRVHRKEDLPERYHLKNHRRVADILLIADLGYTVLDAEYKEDFLDSLPGGAHGYDPEEKEMHAFFIARGPDFKKDTQVGTLRNVDVYELMNHLMDTDPAPNDGSPDSMKILLK